MILISFKHHHWLSIQKSACRFCIQSRVYGLRRSSQRARALEPKRKMGNTLTEYKDLKIAERLKWVKNQKELKIYGIALTGTVKDVLSLGKMKEVNVIRLGQINLP